MEPDYLQHQGRRSFLRTLGKTSILTGLGLTVHHAARQPEVRAAYSRLTAVPAVAAQPTKSSVGRPYRSSRSHPPLPNQLEYETYLKELELRYITPAEIFAAHRRSRNGVSNTLPPRDFWPHIAPTLAIADELRHRLGVPLTYITSAYRSPLYNKQCPGAAKFSQHTQNRALDLVFSCSPKIAFEESLKMRKERLFKGGVGLYSSFIHIDTRGHDATWAA
ncbi:YcbK family protein [Luteolibacter sp. AS25]|uniref:YcbK family protein n=1 Tax=Luteolibacter sp. AS25 TaxID=3135776 RepID=UPI00398ACA77